MANQEIKVYERNSNDTVRSEHLNLSGEIDASDNVQYSTHSDGVDKDKIKVYNNVTNPESEIIHKTSSKKKLQFSKRQKTIPKNVKIYNNAIKVKHSFKKYNHKNRNKKLQKHMKDRLTIVSNVTNQLSAKLISKKVSLCPKVKEVPAILNFAGENICENSEDSISLTQCKSKSNTSKTSQVTLVFEKSFDLLENANIGNKSMFMILDESTKSNVISVLRAETENLTFGDRKNMPASVCNTPNLKNSNVSNGNENTLTHKDSNFIENNNSRIGSMFMIVDEQSKSNINNVIQGQANIITINKRNNAPSCGSFTENQGSPNTEDQGDPCVLTSAPESIQTLIRFEEGASITSSEASVETLINAQKNSQSFLEKTSSSTVNSLTSLQSSTTFHLESDNSLNNNYLKTTCSYNKQKLMDTVIDLGMFPQVAVPRTSNKFNDVIVTERLLTKLNPLNNTEKPDKVGEIKYSSSMSTKPPNTEVLNPKTVKLPNQDIFNDLLKLSEKFDPKQNKEDLLNCPSAITQLWENLIAALDSRIQKIEKSMTEKILTEMKTSLEMLDRLRQRVTNDGSMTNISLDPQTVPLQGLDQYLQCNFEPKPLATAIETAVSNIFVTDSKDIQYNIEPSLEVLKSAVRETEESQDVMKEIVLEDPMPSTSPKKQFDQKFSVFHFVKENMLVLAGAPIFVVMLVCAYFTINSLASTL